MLATVGFFFINLEGSLLDEHRKQYPNANALPWVGVGLFCCTILTQFIFFGLLVSDVKISHTSQEFIVKIITVHVWSDGRFTYREVETETLSFTYSQDIKNEALLD